MRTSAKNDNSLITAMTDLMTSIAVIFLLLLVIYLNHSYYETQKGSENRREKLLNQLISANIEAEKDKKDPLALVIRLHDDRLQFDVNKATIKPNGKTFLKSFIPELTTIICAPDTFNDVESTLIQGFTDSDGNNEHNLKLSQNRAFEILKFSLNNTGLTAKKKLCLLNLSSTNGRGEMSLLPYGSTSGKENKAESRRVEFKIRVKSFEQAKYSKLTKKQH